jgi:hypothetical protein
LEFLAALRTLNPVKIHLPDQIPFPGCSVRHRTLLGNGRLFLLIVVYRGAYEEIRAYVLDKTARWMELCALAAEEQDSVKLLALTQEITRLLDERARRINGQIHKPQPET